jgi:hypothetical protein
VKLTYTVNFLIITTCSVLFLTLAVCISKVSGYNLACEPGIIRNFFSRSSKLEHAVATSRKHHRRGEHLGARHVCDIDKDKIKIKKFRLISNSISAFRYVAEHITVRRRAIGRQSVNPFGSAHMLEPNRVKARTFFASRELRAHRFALLANRSKVNRRCASLLPSSYYGRANG